MRIIVAASTVEEERSRRLEYFHIDPKFQVYGLIPFSGGPRKCVGDQFALLEAIISLASAAALELRAGS